ncbi:MAG TPA: DUF6519 domain-containing protein [Thermoanaerobaculia bacterium]|nr:DUF6519 domain-containing protein [Thermoanaerobaculia bacterium]
MKKDASRDTFQARRHYSRVLMQQGRVQLDADWNEQGDIIGHRIETEAYDVIGRCGAPMHDAGFQISAPLIINFDWTGEPVTTNANPATTKAAPKGKAKASFPAGRIDPFPIFDLSDFLIGPGRYYVDGILCINESLVTYLQQPDLPSPTPLTQAGLYIVYIDVWQRHITTLDDPSIREVALGGPDTATRAKTVWQVKYFFAGAGAQGSCLSDLGFKAFIAAPTGKMLARTRPEKTSTNPCVVPPGAGYRGLENQLYRVEVHDGGNALDITTAPAPIPVTYVADSLFQVTFTSGSWSAGQAVEIVSTKPGANPMNGRLAQIVAVDTGKKMLTLNVDVSAIDAAELQLRAAAATYKWSRENAWVVTTVEKINNNEVTVHDLGPDTVLGFREGQWVELIDDAHELKGIPGQLAKITKIDRAINLVTLNLNPTSLGAHPKMRGWDGAGAIKFEPSPVNDDDLELENGILVRFQSGTYRTGDYWTIPARTATADALSGNIEWPSDGTNPLPLLPFGISHHYCRLAMLQRDGSGITSVQDCRHIFPPITELTAFLYVSGDGQEAMPGNAIPRPLQAAVYNGTWPVVGASVRFTAEGNGHVAANAAGLPGATNTVVITTGSDGIASCFWLPENDIKKTSQQVEARLLDADAAPLPQTIRYNGNLSIADQVWYDPGNCASLGGQTTVQKALSRLSTLVSLYEVSGNGQEGARAAALAEQLVVVAASSCGVASGVKVSFTVTAGKGSVSVAQDTTKADGTARTTWTLDEGTHRQEVLAVLSDLSGSAAPVSVRFVAYLTAEPAIHVTAISDTKSAILNDTMIEATRLLTGIDVICDKQINALSAGSAPPPIRAPFFTPFKPTCYVTIDLPYPIGGDLKIWDGILNSQEIVGYQPTILAGTVEVVKNELHWRPSPIVARWLADGLFERLRPLTDRFLVQLTIEGNFVWADADPKAPLAYLDGEDFGGAAGGRTGIRFPSGNGVQGGTFISWFWIGMPVIDGTGFAGGTINGIVRDMFGTPVPGITVTLSSPAINRTTLTNATGQYSFTGIPAGTYQVSATVGNATVKTTVGVPSSIIVAGPPNVNP